MDTTSLIAAFTPSKILVQTSVLPLIAVEPQKKTWLGTFLAPVIFIYEGDAIYKIDTVNSSFKLSSQAEVDALPNNWANVIALGAGVFFAALIMQKIFKKG